MGNQTDRFAGVREAILQAENELAQRQYNTDPEFRAVVHRLTDMTIAYCATETAAATAEDSAEAGVTGGLLVALPLPSQLPRMVRTIPGKW